MWRRAYAACSFPFFFFNDTATTEIYTLSLHDALPISRPTAADVVTQWNQIALKAIGTANTSPAATGRVLAIVQDRKSTRLNSSHLVISYAVFCLKKKNAVEHLRLITI